MSKRSKLRHKFGQNRHHLIPSIRMKEGVPPYPSNLLWIYEYRHKAWHELFNEMTLDEVIELLTRLRRLKCAAHAKH